MSSNVPIKTEEVILENVEYQSTEELDEELQLQLEDSGGESYIIQGEQTYEHHSPSSKQSSASRQRHNSSGNNMSSQGGTKLACGTLPPPPSVNKTTLENEKRMRREIANSNERRRMQSINAGFQNLRSLLPRHEGEKLSKAAILQQTSQYICELENQKTQLLAQNSQLKRQLGQHEATGGGGGGGNNTGSQDNTTTTAENNSNIAIKKRKLTDNVANVAQTISDSSDEGLGSMSPEPMTLLNAAAAGGGSSAAVAAAANAAANAANTKAQILLAQNIKELTELKDQLFKERRLRTMLEEELQMIKRQLYSVATAPQPTAVVEADETDGTATTTHTYIPREVIEHTGNLLRGDDCEEFSYVEIDELTGQQQVVVCSSIEELDSETAAAEIITEDHVHEEVVLSSSSTESEQEVAVNAIAKVYAEGNTPTPAMLQPILQAAIKATPKVEVERISDAALKKVKTEKIEQTSGLTRSRQNLETIVEQYAIWKAITSSPTAMVNSTKLWYKHSPCEEQPDKKFLWR
ncbi:LOW QUALITY PROTEIN: uncharacterized protein LOC133325011 [Musca vetustissima]|uniref:LOW QUALITY PROTEIN: uncharacterized protein LOC133325011 n=1 Tax=Musca vetustissima TaxID=27455 RepID=UPI002AB77E6B|nr:LOW QUALITY PROTEIN: uncharacterized protein LOC133325011 [Musca vetustissima]